MAVEETYKLAGEKRAAGKIAEAEGLYRQILSERPAHFESRMNLGSMLHDGGRFADAVLVYRLGLALDASQALMWSNLGNTLCEMDEALQAVAACRQALVLDPRLYTAHNNMGNALKRAGDVDAARLHYEIAISLRPDFVMAHNNLATVLHAQGDLGGAATRLRHALEILPDYPEAHSNLGNTLTDMGLLQEGLAECRKSLLLNPDYALGHWNLGLMLLRLGEFEAGWAEYEWRWKIRSMISPKFEFPQPAWDGRGDLRGRRILLHAEQGLGDAIQFARYATLVSKRGGRVLFYCLPDLVRLMRTVPGVDEVIGWDKPLPAFELQCPLMTLPRLFWTTLATIPADVPYLSADAALSAQWRSRLQGVTEKKIGLAWAGRASHYNDRNRSIPLAKLAALADVSGVRFFSLQKGQSPVNASVKLTDWTGELTDFADTSALVANLDLVITADTSVAHLAGAMGKPVWVMLPLVADFRWMIERGDSPWYPTMRLFRQKKLGAWEAVAAEVAAALREI